MILKQNKVVDPNPVVREVIKQNIKAENDKTGKTPRTTLANALSSDINKNIEKYKG